MIIAACLLSIVEVILDWPSRVMPMFALGIVMIGCVIATARRTLLESSRNWNSDDLQIASLSGQTHQRRVCAGWAASRTSRQRIYFPNHTSNLDGVIFMERAARRIAGRHAVPLPLPAITGRRDGCDISSPPGLSMPFDRAKKVTVSNNPIEQMLEAIGQTYSLIIFPEGGFTGIGAEVGAFKGGLYHLGKKRPISNLVPGQHIDNANRSA